MVDGPCPCVTYSIKSNKQNELGHIHHKIHINNSHQEFQSSRNSGRWAPEGSWGEGTAWPL